jgi:4-hydroxy-tetrahydrodipicolinate synthase
MATTERIGDRLTPDNLRGVWAAIATPFDEHDRFDEAVFRENLRRLAAAGVHGVYTTDSDGEFYALDLDEFKRIVDVFADETQRLGIPTQVGVTWCDTRGTVERLRHAAERGILGAHVGHPFYMPMTPGSYRAFWEDVRRAVPERFALIHYNTHRSHNYLYGPDYPSLQELVPNLIGTKHVSTDASEFLTLTAYAPQLSHFTCENVMTPFMLLGAKGVYSWFANFNPAYLLAWYDDIEQGRWDLAKHRQERMHAFILATVEHIHGDGNQDAIVGKAISAASPFLVAANRTRRPYLPVPQEAIDRFRRVVDEEFSDLRWQP